MAKGFTLVELLITVGIFAVVSGVVLTRNTAFDNEVLLNDLAYDVALAVREAQQWGINVRASGGEFDRPYGVYFEADTNTFSQFADIDGDGFYDAPGEEVKKFTLGRGAKIAAVCDLGEGGCGLDYLTILFKRPDPDAIIGQGGISRARIELTTPRGGTRHVLVESTGQISIQKPSE